MIETRLKRRQEPDGGKKRGQQARRGGKRDLGEKKSGGPKREGGEISVEERDAGLIIRIRNIDSRGREKMVPAVEEQGFSQTGCVYTTGILLPYYFSMKV